jgi:hypothetical protein
MTKFLKKSFFLLACILFIQTQIIKAQQVSNLTISDAYEQYRDSLKNTPYEWSLPILGGKLRESGFDIPYPNGISVLFAYSKQDIVIGDAFVGFDTDNLIGIDGIARFRQIQAKVTGYSARYDFWLLPFLNFYGLAGVINSKTNIQLGLPIELEFNTDNNGTVVGWGTVVAGAIGPLIVQGDFTMAWTFMKNLNEPSRSIIAGLRTGYLLRFRNKPSRNIAFLVGVQYLGLNPNGSGVVDLEKLVGITPDDKSRALEQLDQWYAGLTDTEQKVLAPIYDGASSWLSSSDPVKLDYRFKKTLPYPVSLNVSVNLEWNKRYNFLANYTFLGSRNQLVIGLTYRFGWKGKNLLRGVTL